ncbi:DUF927 domain-containing protein [Escherichia coli]|uniref:TOPRIM and DUF927 domain-containing protein n=1 Tax=Escherichia coli TaxID=562 RepID=UPI000690C1F0|nr:DUF927 domain-containing protein [Escherichia coli]EEC8106389.1 DUF927 domain-containing protein [Escherichia coli]EEY8651904.1 DUF927 domain-containing protein [Escherichia coli]EGQ5989462.1 DUF927 domain-containing protein [Escherichia coli]EGR6700833.1 DUF927 domain-containing protein [Escherichia coli]EHI0384222.1 DUF927 domain-containing protein [Escherichia coli]
MMQPQHVHDSTTVTGVAASSTDTVAAVHTSGTQARTGAAATPVIADGIRDELECLRRDVVKGMASPYLAGKGLERFAAKLLVLSGGRTLIPMQDASGVVVAFQTISADGKEKRFRGKAKGAFRIINPQEQPTRIVIAEGLATALSAGQLQHGAMAVMAGSASNLEDVARTMRERHPEAEIIIAADNDNTGKGKNTGKVAAEKAALAVGGTVALAPAEAGENRDWNDVLVSEGCEAATMRFAGSMYRPTATEKTTSSKRRRASSDGESGVVIEDTDEGPMMRLRFRDTSLDICQKVDVVGYGSYEGKEYRVLRWMNNGRPATVAVNLGGFASSAALTTLMDGGLLVRDGRQLRSALANWIIGQKPATRWTLAASAGWTDDNRAYLLPDGHIIGDENPALFMGKRNVTGGWTTSGTADTWRESVARLVDGNSLMMVCVAMPFAGPLLKLADIQNFGLHLYAPSTTGKTTCATLAASVCGEPSALKMTWNGTASGIGNKAAARCDSFLWLDELGEGNPKAIDKAIYALFNGSGRIRAAQDGGDTSRDSWRLPVISTGEADTVTFAGRARITLAPGQLVRLLNIPVESMQPENLHGYPTAGAHARALTRACNSSFGAVFREWITWLIRNRQEAENTTRQRLDKWQAAAAEKYPDSPQVCRVADAFAVLEAALVLTRPFTGWDAAACCDAVVRVFTSWVKDFGTHDKAQSQIISQATDFLMQYGRSRFATLTTDGKANTVTDQEASRMGRLYGYRKPADGDNGDEWFYVAPAAFRDHIAKGHNDRQAAAALEKAGMLACEAGRLQVRLRIGGSQQYFYKVKLTDGGE